MTPEETKALIDRARTAADVVSSVTVLRHTIRDLCDALSALPSHPDEKPLVDSRYEYGIAAHPAFGDQVTPIMHDDPRQPDRRRRIDTYAWEPTDPNGDTHNER